MQPLILRFNNHLVRGGFIVDKIKKAPKRGEIIKLLGAERANTTAALSVHADETELAEVSA